MGASLLGEDRKIILTNDKWQEKFKELELSPQQMGAGNKFPEILAKAGCSERIVRKIKSEINRVITGEIEEFKQKAALKSASIKRWQKYKITDYMDGVLILQEDITGEKQNKKQPGIQELEMAKFSLDNADMMIYRVTPAGIIEYVNKKTCEKLGYEKDELIGREARNLVVEQFLQQRNEYWQNIKSSGSITFEKELITKSGNTFPVSAMSQYFVYGEEEYELFFARDISARKKMEKELRIREQTGKEL